MDMRKVESKNKTSVCVDPFLTSCKLYKNTKDWFSQHKMELPFLKTNHGRNGNYIYLNERKVTNFSSYNYLGLSDHDDVIKGAKTALEKYGTSASASRLVGGQNKLHVDLEQELSSFIGTEDCMVFSSGHATNVSIIGHLMSSLDIIFYDIQSHNSLIEGGRLSGAKCVMFHHNDMEHLLYQISKYRNNYRNAMIVVEGVYSMDGDICPLPELVEIKNEFNCKLMVDEAHSFGILGDKGKGCCDHFSIDPKNVDVNMGTLSKSLASCGGYITGSSELILGLKHSCPGFIFSAAISPSNTGAALASLRVLKDNPYFVKELSSKVELIKNALSPELVIHKECRTPIIPIITGDSIKAAKLYTKLLEHEICAYPIVSPAVKNNMARIRLFINRDHSKEQLEKSASTINKFMETI